MSALIDQFIVTFSATILALIVFKFVGYLLYKKHDKTFESFNFIRPLDALDRDLGRVFEDVNSRLPRNRKTSCFPVVFDVGLHTNTYCKQGDLVEIISAQLELAGWIVTKTAACGQSEIILDIPRKDNIL